MMGGLPNVIKQHAGKELGIQVVQANWDMDVQPTAQIELLCRHAFKNKITASK